MKRSCTSLILLLLVAAASIAGQTKTKLRPTSFIESRQGNHPNGPDVIGHGKVSQDDTMMCLLVETYDPESQRPSTACVIQFGIGQKHTLAFHESMRVPEDSEAYLECAGDKPRRCGIVVNPPPTANEWPAQAD